MLKSRSDLNLPLEAPEFDASGDAGQDELQGDRPVVPQIATLFENGRREL